MATAELELSQIDTEADSLNQGLYVGEEARLSGQNSEAGDKAADKKEVAKGQPDEKKKTAPGAQLRPTKLNQLTQLEATPLNSMSVENKFA